MRQPSRILVVDDNLETRLLLADVLEGDGYEAVACPGGAEALEILGREHFDLILADIRMTGMSGMELLDRIREIPLEVGVIVMTAYGSKETAIRALRGKALDYLEKPFGLAQLRAAVRRALPAQPQQVRWRGIRSYEDLTLDVESHRTLVVGSEVELTKIEFDLLAYLFGRLGCPVPVQELLEQVWGDQEPGARGPDSVKSCVCRLRRKIGDDARQPRYIRNVRGVGYQLGGVV
jgi:DNA-binding response OmpR family regulator